MEPCHNCRCPDRDSNRAAPEYKLSLKQVRCGLGRQHAVHARAHTHTHTHTHTHIYIYICVCVYIEILFHL